MSATPIIPIKTLLNKLIYKDWAWSLDADRGYNQYNIRFKASVGSACAGTMQVEFRVFDRTQYFITVTSKEGDQWSFRISDQENLNLAKQLFEKLKKSTEKDRKLYQWINELQ